MELEMNDWFKSARKKLCGHSNKYTFRRNGKTFSGTRCNPYTGPATEDQKEIRQRFKDAIAVRGIILHDNDLRKSWNRLYMDAKQKKQTTAYSLNGYIVQEYFAGHIDADGSVKA